MKGNEVSSSTEAQDESLGQFIKDETKKQVLKNMQPLEGHLSKYTNVMKGWQPRFFIVNPRRGTLDYFVTEEGRQHRPRGGIHLALAQIVPSDEDSQTFTVISANENIYKLRAIDAKERMQWVNGLRTVAQYHTELHVQTNPSPSGSRRSHRSATPSPTHSHGGSGRSSLRRAQMRVMNNSASLYDAFSSAREILLQAEFKRQAVARAIEDLPSSGVRIKCTDPDLLLLKAASQAAILCMEQCLSILQQQHQATSSYIQSGSVQGIEWIDSQEGYQKGKKVPSKNVLKITTASRTNDMEEAKATSSTENLAAEDATTINDDDEVSDKEDYSESDLGTVDEHKSVILHLLSQLKLGMDLTRVVLPTFILECRSLLEMFADFMGHPDLFVSITDAKTPEDRMLAMIEWYLTSFHVGRKGAIAKKPYNPIIGETFTCSWRVPQQKVSPTSPPPQPPPNETTTTTATPPNCNNNDDNNADDHKTGGDDGKGGAGKSGDVKGGDGKSGVDDKSGDGGCGGIKLRYIAEQVSHHPPISAFYVECPEKKMCLNCPVWTKSKFTGMSIGVNMIGEAVLYLREHGEEYVFQLPNAFARSILTVPWVELGGKISITCRKSGCSASVMFHTKPFYGGKLHKVTAEVKNGSGSTICKVQGEWNGVLEFSYSDDDVKTIDTNGLSIYRKRVRPLGKQGPFESRKLWHGVTTALREGDTEAATTHKTFLEDRQRTEERARIEAEEQFPARYFKPNGDGWTHVSLLEAVQQQQQQQQQEETTTTTENNQQQQQQQAS